LSNLTIALGRPTLADRIFSRSLALDFVLVAAGAALTAVAAQVTVPLQPVPITGQTLAVLLVGVTLGATRGGLSLLLYAVLGLVGLPVFAPQDDGSHLTGFAALSSPSFGYIIGFIFAAILTGWLAQREWDRKLFRNLLAFLAGSVVPFAFGLPWLAVALGNLGYPNDLNSVLVAGFYPFIIGGIIKAVLGAAIIALAWVAVRSSDRRKAGKNDAATTE
jgi:biotin transport system substrate-specific component